MENILTVGDDVMWRGSWGKDTPKQVQVIGIEVNCERKHGDSVSNVKWSKVDSRSVVVDLDCGNWAYGTQIKQIS